MKKSKILNWVLMAGIITAPAFLAGCYPAEGGEADTSGTIMFVVILVLFIGFFYFFMIRPQRRQKKEHEQLLDSLKNGDRVVTVGGIYGQIENLNDENVVLKVESGATIRVARGSVMGRRETGSGRPPIR